MVDTEEINVLVSEIVTAQKEAKEIMRELKTRLNAMPGRIAEKCSSRAELIETARYLYWEVPFMSRKVIARDMFGVTVYQLLKTVGPKLYKTKCYRCGEVMMLPHKSHSEQVSVMCDGCQKRRQQKEIRNLKEEEGCAKRTRQLRAMPYGEYLRTPEWQFRRKKHLKAAGYRCEVCNSKKPLDVHHRTYERRGEEYYSDLIALCRSCHTLFHKAGKIK